MAKTIYGTLQKLSNMLIICYIKNGFLIVLNYCKLLVLLIWPGNAFQCWAAILLNPLSTILLFMLNRTAKCNVVDDDSCVFLMLFFILILFLKYVGPIPRMVL